ADGLRPAEISGQDLRVAVGRTLGWQHLKSTAFELQQRGDAYRFTGHGSGHGVGMCVIGSARLAERGVTAEAILARYFPGLTISGAGPVVASVAPSRNPNAKGAQPRNELSRGSDPGGADIVPSGAAAGPILVTLPD